MNSNAQKSDSASIPSESTPISGEETATPTQTPTQPPITPGPGDVDEAEDKDIGEADRQKFEKYLNDVATGKIPFAIRQGRRPARYSEYAYNLSGYLSHTLGMTRTEVVTLALCHYARALTSAPIVVQHDLAMLTQGLQMCVTDLTHEVAEMSMLALQVADQEEIAGPATKQ